MTDQVTESSADDADAFVAPTASGEDIHSGKTVEITQKELDDLGELLAHYQAILLGHENRLLEHEGRITELEQKKPVKLEIPRGRSR